MQQMIRMSFFIYFFFVLISLEAANNDAKTKAMKSSQPELYDKQQTAFTPMCSAWLAK